ncbi:MAG: ribonuclease activity regulator RraA, partial [Alphaproteobacteria bacterium]
MTAERPMSEETCALLGRASTATLTTQLLKRGFRNTFLTGIKPLHPAAARFVGAAFTLRTIPAREDLDRFDSLVDPDHPQRKAIETIGPGQVLVIDCRGETGAGALGGILATRLKVRGAAAVVTDGGVRDAEEIERLGLPVFCAGPAALPSLTLHHAVEVQTPIACGGVAVYPGDLLVGDADGVVVIPRDLAAEVA